MIKTKVVCNRTCFKFLFPLSVILFFLSINMVDAQTQKKPYLMVHYMPWFQSKDFSGNWGWHWTMNKFDPNKIVSGKREIASHFYPVTGPYDSQDPDILEYQVLLMKISGVDGVLVDWYGDENYYDYAILNKSTGAIFNWIKKADLKFGIVYEDQTIKHMINGGKISTSSAITYATKAINYVYTNWANSPTYLKIDGKPVLLVFGPQYFKTSAEWENIFSPLNPKPLFFTEDNYLSPVSAGAYPWPPMSLATNGILTITKLNEYLAQFYNKAAFWNYKIGGAFPGFKDIYKEAGVSNGYGILDPLNGFTFSSSLDRAITQNCDIIQIVTWNDYGEGTIVEPTLEFGTQYLEKIQEVKKQNIDQTFPYNKNDLSLPMKIFKMRKTVPWGLFFGKTIDQAFNFAIANNTAKANRIIDSLMTLTDINGEVIPTKTELLQNYPNPFNPETVISYKLSDYSFVRLIVYDVLGNEIGTLVNEFQLAGIYHSKFNTQKFNLTSGIYFYRLQAGNYNQVKKIVLAK